LADFFGNELILISLVFGGFMDDVLARGIAYYHLRTGNEILVSFPNPSADCPVAGHAAGIS
jgi:hypothetical protein